jgi:hypothetical protein
MAIIKFIVATLRHYSWTIYTLVLTLERKKAQDLRDRREDVVKGLYDRRRALKPPI